MHHHIAIGIGAVAAAMVINCSTIGQDLESLRGTIRIDGSSTVYPITEAIAEEFSELAPNVRVTVGYLGHGRRVQTFHGR